MFLRNWKQAFCISWSHLILHKLKHFQIWGRSTLCTRCTFLSLLQPEAWRAELSDSGSQLQHWPPRVQAVTKASPSAWERNRSQDWYKASLPICVLVPRPGKAPITGAPPSARPSQPHQAQPDNTIQGTFSWKPDKNINPATCDSTIWNQPRGLTQLTWASRDPSWQLCPSLRCRSELSAPGASLCPWIREGNQRAGLDQPSDCSEQGSSRGNWKYCASFPQTQWEMVSSHRIYYILIRQQVDISLASTHVKTTPQVFTSWALGTRGPERNLKD